MIKFQRAIAAALLLFAAAQFTQQAQAKEHGGAPHPIVQPLLTKPLSDIAGKEALMLMVEFPPGGVDPIHRHDAHAFVYVLEGEIEMGVKGAQPVTLRPGETFYEGPNDIHTIGRNTSKTKPARFVVVLVKKSGVDAVLPVK